MFAGLDATQGFLVFKAEQQKYICLQRVTWKRERQGKSGQWGERVWKGLGKPWACFPITFTIARNSPVHGSRAGP